VGRRASKPTSDRPWCCHYTRLGGQPHCHCRSRGWWPKRATVRVSYMKAAARILARMHVRARRPRCSVSPCSSVAREPMMVADIGDRHAESAALIVTAASPPGAGWRRSPSTRPPSGAQPVGAGRRRDRAPTLLGRHGGQDCRGDDPPVRGDAVPTFTTSLVPARLPERCRPAQAVGRAPAPSRLRDEVLACWPATALAAGRS
jgi:hypothetical protein